MAVKDALGQFTRYAYDVKGQKIAEFGDNTYPLRFEYDAFGQMISHYTFRVPDAPLTSEPSPNQGDKTSYTYDLSTGLLTAKTFADHNATRYTYDVNGKLASRIWARGITTHYSYDPFGQLLSTTYSDSTPSITNTYNALGCPQKFIDAKGTTILKFNQYLNLTTEIVVGAYSKTLDVGYNNWGKRNSLKIGMEYLVEHQYDDIGRYTGMNVKNHSLEYQFLNEINLISKILRSNTINSIINYEEKRNLITSFSSQKENSPEILASYRYIYDPLARRVTIKRSGEVFDYKANNVDYIYNTRSEMISAQYNIDSSFQSEYQYDNIGNRTSAIENTTNKDYTTNALNQYTNNGDFVSPYDADGNQTKIKTSTGEWLVTYNGENRPAKFVQGKTEIIMEYDSRGRRFGKKVFKDGHLDAHLKYVYFGFRLIETLDGLNGDRVIQKYIWGLNDELSFVLDNENIYFTHHDANRNVTELTDVSGNLVAHYEYDSLGRLMQSEGNAADNNPFRFSSEYHDDELGLIYYNYRHYTPTNGRWISRDPIGETDGGYHLYGFLHNSPINDADYLGLFGDGQRDPKTGEHKEGNENNPKGHGDLGTVGFDYTGEDNDWITSPYNPLSTGNHFQDFRESLREVQGAVKECDKEKFERRMHRLQDFWTHFGKGYTWDPFTGMFDFITGEWTTAVNEFGHAFDGGVPDNDEEAWEDAQEWTLIMEAHWFENCCKNKKGDWVKKEESCKK